MYLFSLIGIDSILYKIYEQTKIEKQNKYMFF